MVKTKTKPKRKAKTGALSVQRNGFAALVADAAHKLMGLRPIIDRDYTIPFVRREHVLWMKFVSKDDKHLVTWNPYVIHKGMIDVLSQRGYRSIECIGLDPRPCLQAGCYQANEKDYMQRAACRIELKNRSWVRMEADACRHNTSSMISGYGKPRGNAMARMAETRAMDRVISRLCNVGAVSILELPELDKSAVWKQGDRIMSTSEINTIIEGEVLNAESQPVHEKTQEAEQPEQTEERMRANRALHGALSELGIAVEPFHKYVHATSTKVYKRNIASMKDLTVSELNDWTQYLKGLGPDELDKLRAWSAKEGQK